MLGAGWLGPTYAMVQGISPPHMRALGSAIVVFVVNLIGMGLGPFAVGALNDALAPAMGLEAVRYSLMLAAVPHVLAAGLSVLAARTLRLDLAQASRPVETKAAS
jgi:MFS family permease